MAEGARRSAASLVGALGQRKHYRAALGIFRTFTDPLAALRRYLTGSGTWPWVATLRTPTGRTQVTLQRPDDVVTVVEIFCRRDYGTGRPRVVADIGANIGMAALYFLTRRPDSVVTCFEPVPANLDQLRHNLEPFRDRVTVREVAVSTHNGEAEFLVEETGRYSGLASYSSRQGHVVTVPTVAIGDALRDIIEAEGRIDLVKIDTEGSEADLVAAIPADMWQSLGAVVYEDNAGGTVELTGTEAVAAQRRGM